eukprot:tig00000823_g4555.t1
MDPEVLRRETKPVILYDGVCGLCNGGVEFVLWFESGDAFRFAALQSEKGRSLLRAAGRDPDDISTIVLISEGRAFTKSEAVLRIGRRLQNPLPLLALLGLGVPPFVRDLLYDQVASNRYSFFGRRDECRLSDPDPARAAKFLS